MVGITSLVLMLVLPGPGLESPDGWRTEAPREEIAPVFRVERIGSDSSSGLYILCQEGRGDAAVDGRWVRTVAVKGKGYYQFTALYQAAKVDDPERSVLARVDWLDARGKRVETPEYPVTSPHRTPDGWTVLTGTYAAPEGSSQAKLELHLRWAPLGKVRWRDAELKPTSPPMARPVRLATVNHRPRGTHSPQENLDQFAALVEDA